MAVGCPPPPEPVPPEPPPRTGTCESACFRLRQLGCKEAEPSPGGQSCEAVCWNVEDAGVEALKWPKGCLSAVLACSETLYCSTKPDQVSSKKPSPAP